MTVPTPPAGVISNFLMPFFRHWYRKLRPLPIQIHLGSDETYLRTRSEWTNDVHVLITTQRIGLTNSRITPVSVRVIVEKINGQTVIKPLRVSDSREGTDIVAVPPSKDPLVFVDLVAHYLKGEFGAICYAQTSHEDMMPRHALIDLRVQSDSGVEGRARISARTHLVGGIPDQLRCELIPN